MSLVLVDMDGVLADFHRNFIDIWNERYGHIKTFDFDELTNYRFIEEVPGEADLVKSIYTAKGFILNLPVIGGCIEALEEMLMEGHDVKICTSPLSDYKNCVLEKYQWIDRHFGTGWINNIVVSKDKTVIKGDYLMDDRPNIKGLDSPEWEHIIFDRPYNRHVTDKRRLVNWMNWRDIIRQA